MAQDISYSDGSTVKGAVVVVWEDLGNERAGYYRAFWAAPGEDGTGKDATSGSPVIGYCSAGGSHKTVRAVAAEVRRIYPGEVVYRNGREVR